ncbi:MAG: cation-translocating P-type ATPase [Cytophagales bacterium]|nr:cation-translocating P-type ATPase [Cytophagales bacterium]
MKPLDAPFTLLDTPAQWCSFSHKAKNKSEPIGTWESSIVIDGMHCTACAMNVERALQQSSGVIRADINAASHRGRVVWREDATLPSKWMQAIVDAGYSVRPAQDAEQLAQRRRESRLALWRWLVAGFCMMQVMMYAYPEYVARPGEMSDEARHLMRWASWVITLPVMLFSCRPFFASAWQDLKHRRISMDLPVALGMAITFVVSTLGTFEPASQWGREVYFDSLTMFVFFLLTGRWLELLLRDRTAGALEALINRMPESALRQLPSGEFERVLLRQLAAGDTVRVAVGEAFPADGMVLNGTTHADEALLTGESRPIQKNAGDAVIAGSHNLDASVLIRIEKIGEATRFAQIVRLMEQASLEKPQLAQLADRLAKPFLLSILVVAGLVVALGWSHSPSHAFMTAVAVLIVTCPCALSLATPVAMLASAGALAKRGVLVRRLQALETLSKIDTIIFDKTGTLTKDGLKLSNIKTREGIQEHTAYQLAGLLAADSLHPVSQAIVAHNKSWDAPRTIGGASAKTEQAGNGVTAQIDGHVYRFGSAQFCAVTPLQTTAVQAHLSDATGWLASFEFQERIRPDAAQTLLRLQAEHLSVQLLSGDSQLATQHLANQLHIANYQGLCTPDIKLAKLQSLQKQGHSVAMVGDGLNDGPVLAGADVSFAFGRAVPLTQSKSDFLVLGENLEHIAITVRQAKRTMQIVKQNLVWALLYNVIAVPFAVMGLLPAWLAGIGMASSSLLVVANAMRLRHTQ